MRKYLTVLVYTQTNIRLSVGGQRWILTMARSGLVNSPPSFGEWLLTITSYYFVDAMRRHLGQFCANCYEKNFLQR